MFDMMQRFFPSEFGLDVDRGSHVEPAKSIYEIKAQIRRITEAAGIPYTYVSSNLSAGIYLSNLNKMGYVGPPVNRITIFGNGNRKGNSNRNITFQNTVSLCMQVTTTSLLSQVYLSLKKTLQNMLLKQ